MSYSNPSSIQGDTDMQSGELVFHTPISSRFQTPLNKNNKRPRKDSPLTEGVPNRLDIVKLKKDIYDSVTKIEKEIINQTQEQETVNMLINKLRIINDNVEKITTSYNVLYARIDESSAEEREEVIIKTIRQTIQDETKWIVQEINGTKGDEIDSMETSSEGEGDKSLKGLIMTLNKEVQEIKQSIGKGTTSENTYANKLKMANVSKPLIPQKKPSILIYPDDDKKEEMNSSKITKDAVMRAIKPSSVGVRVEKVRELKNAGISIELTREEDVMKFQASDIWREIGVTTRVPGKKSPKIAIYNVPVECNDEHIIEELKSQNIQIQDQSIKVIGKMGPRNRDTTTVIIECTPYTRKTLIDKGKLYLEWSVCHIKDHISILQCYKCQEFGHLAQKCTSKTPVCRHCGSEEHDSRNCEEKAKENFKPTCTLCKKFGNLKVEHMASDSKNCEIWKRKYQATLRNIDYD